MPKLYSSAPVNVTGGSVTPDFVDDDFDDGSVAFVTAEVEEDELMRWTDEEECQRLGMKGEFDVCKPVLVKCFVDQ